MLRQPMGTIARVTTRTLFVAAVMAALVLAACGGKSAVAGTYRNAGYFDTPQGQVKALSTWVLDRDGTWQLSSPVIEGRRSHASVSVHGSVHSEREYRYLHGR
jgi:hypothetical protein